jgi:hypothetical protein
LQPNSERDSERHHQAEDNEDQGNDKVFIHHYVFDIVIVGLPYS